MIRIRRSNLKKLIETYRAIEEYQKSNRGIFPSFRDLIDRGAFRSLDNVGYWFESMEAADMLIYERKIARSSRLRPISEWNIEVQQYIKENGT